MSDVAHDMQVRSRAARAAAMDALLEDNPMKKTEGCTTDRWGSAAAADTRKGNS